MKNNKILILGADGFIGSNMIFGLVKENRYHIRAFDFFKNGMSRNLESLRGKIEFFPGDFLNRDDVRKAVKGVDYAFHLLSSTTPGSSMNDPFIDINTNVFGMLSFLEECVAAKVKKIIFSSSGGTVYGNQGKLRYSEEDNTNPVSPYGISKLTIEKYLEYYKIHHGLDYLILRYSNLYGPRQNISGSQGIIPIFLNLVEQGKPVSIFGDGENIRDYLYIDDAVENTKRIFRTRTKYNIYNVGSGKGNTINEIVEIIRKCTGKEIKVSRLPARDIDVRRVILNVKRIKKEIDYQLKTTLAQGILKTFRAMKKIKK